ncbi:Alpha-1,3-mannosyl-glycoprotein 2-beta-N-acetylglucosaminyltransferase [Meloidogyne graminicola]|uniref:Alpha-1,3-mannosyl-glycoprotein 2-beta-N-acetylglucosaminyltransferase n=1 Tax=Meloidogyne graminicola TaxID=189291 RepID=A0A8S9ZX77_9BILA|nr:Alpha-1,3-mannosyl-glycoprotein 2-beta-N-acetylglucosaminyltransferase [Meloidogyne graminicola]
MDWSPNRQFTSLARLKYFCCSINYYNYLNRRQNKQKSLSCFCNVKRFVLAFVLLIFCSTILSVIILFYYLLSDVITLETFAFVDQTNVLFTQQIHLESDSKYTITSQNEKTIISRNEQIALLVFCAKRPKAIKNHLEQLNRLRPSPKHFPIFVSQDGFDNEVTSVINEFNSKTTYFTHFQHTEQKNSAPKSVINYLRISQHYKWALDKVFLENNFKTVIITEDDLDISPDFFIYFNSTKSLLYSDPTIWCISAWNDNGNPSLVDWENGINKLWRTDFFPGLGWMLRSELWMELRENWPEVYWDDWLRSNNIRHNRACIRPEISRTLHNFSVAGKGSSDGLYKNFLSSMRLHEKIANFSQNDLKRLEKDNFDIWLRSELENSIELSLQEILDGKYKKYQQQKTFKNPPFFVRFNDPREYRNLSKTFSLMADIRSGMMRTAYLGKKCERSGGSAGLPIVISIMSCVLNKRPVNDLVYTGELIDSNGHLKAVGGLVYKLAASQVLGKKRILLPFGMKKEFEGLSLERKEGNFYHLLQLF